MKFSAALSLFLLASQQNAINAFAPIKPGRQTTTLTPTARIAPTLLNMADVPGPEASSSDRPFLNVGTVVQSVGTQALVGSTILTGGVGAQILANQAHFDPASLVLGLAGLAPLWYVSNRVETSESPYVAGLNLSTNMAVLRLFGSKQQTSLAFGISALLGVVTGVVEEVIFRGQILPQAAAWSVGGLGIASSAAPLAGAAISTVVFALLHTNPTGFFKGGDQLVDNTVLLAFQLVTGSIFASLYLATGNLAVPIIAHALYDTYTFFNTHLQVSGQMEYAASRKSNIIMGSTEIETKWMESKGDDFVESARETFYLMDTNQDGMLSRKELRVALFSYGINLSQLESEQVTSAVDADQSGSIDFGEFLEFIGPTGSTHKAVRNALL